MNKEIRINWNIGMELTPEVFIHLENQLAEYRLLLRKVQASKLFGLIPNTEFKATVSVEGDTLTMNEVKCQALLQNGEMVNLDVNETITTALGDRYDTGYLAVWPTDETIEYEQDDVPFIENKCQFGLRSLEELPGSMPLAKLKREEGVWKIQEDYILPLIAMNSSATMVEMVDAIRQLVTQITRHEKFKFLPNHDLMTLLVEEMGSLDGNQHPKDFVVLCRRFVRLFSYLIPDEPMPIADYNPYDIQLFLFSICSFLIKAHELLPSIKIVEYQPVEKQEPSEETESEPQEDCPIL